MCTTYVIGKAKSVFQTEWLWRPIAAKPQPMVSKLTLTRAVRAFTSFLRVPTAQIPMLFFVHKVTDVAPSCTWTALLHLNAPCELDCKEQFNEIRPKSERIIEHMQQASTWL